mgnify:CR=1 FL=1
MLKYVSCGNDRNSSAITYARFTRAFCTHFQSESETLREALEVIIEKNGWTKVEHEATKAQQLYQCMQTRHGNMLVGSTLSGKSTVLSMLEQALTYLDSKG